MHAHGIYMRASVPIHSNICFYVWSARLGFLLWLVLLAGGEIVSLAPRLLIQQDADEHRCFVPPRQRRD